jgi:eukaryotic-like serine/threonine-protein kinase
MQKGLRLEAQASRLQTAFLISVLSAAPWALDSSAQAPDSWPQFRGNPALTGVTASTPPAAPKVLWSIEAGEAIESSAAIADGRVFVGVASGHLLALNLADGKELWKYPVEQGIGESSPAVSGGLVYIGDLGGVFHAVNAADGKPAWTFRTKGEIKSSPVIAGDRVLIGSYDSNLYALAAKDGKLLWSVKTENYVHGTPAVADGLVYLAGCDEVFRAIRIADGKEAYRIETGAYTGASVALAGGKAYFGNFNNEVVGLDLKSRTVSWRYSHPDRQFPFYSSAAVADGLVVLGGRDKMVHGIDAVSGKGRWTFATRARVDSSPVVGGGRVYVGSSDGRFYVLDLAKGEKIWEFDMGGPLSASPAVAAGRIVIGSQDGRLICFG